MKLYRRLNLTLFGISFFALTLAACGSKESGELEGSLECGPGTVLSGEQCIIADFACPQGQVPLPAGGCAEPSVFCGGNTIYDVELERCVAPERIECGEGTVAVDNRCLVKDAMSCGEGTVLADGECRLAASVCGVGTALDELQCQPTERACGPFTIFDVIHQTCVYPGAVECGEDTIEENNRCVPLHTFVDELAQEATVDYAAIPVDRVIDPGDEVGNRVVFKGAMTGSTGLYHVYSLNAVPGTWLKVTVYPQGIPSVGFRARTAFTDWERKAPAGKSAVASRYLAPISTESLDLIIETSLSGTGTNTGIANESWTYVGVVEVVDPPESRDWLDVETNLSGQIDDRATAFIEVPLLEDEAILITPQELGPDAEKPLVEVWESPTKFKRTIPIQHGEPFSVAGIAGQDSVFLRFDAISLNGPRINYSVVAQHALTLQGGLAMEQEIYAQAGQMLFFAHESAAGGPVAAQIIKGDEVVYSQDEVLARNKSGNFTSRQSNRGFFYIQEDGDYTVRFENTGTTDYEEFFPTVFVQDVPTLTFPAGEPTTLDVQLEGQDLRPGQWRFVVVEAADSALFEGSTTFSRGSSQLSILGTDNEELLSYTSSSSFSFDVYVPLTFIIAYRPSSTTTLVSGIELSLKAEPNQLLPPQEIYQRTFDAEIFDILSGEISYRNGGAPTVRLYNPDDSIIFETTMTSKSLDLFELIPGDGEFTLEVINRSDEPTVDLAVDIELTSPLAEYNFSEPATESITVMETLEKGSRQFVLMRATAELKHTIQAITDADEELTLRLLNFRGLTEVDSISGAEEINLNFTNLPAGLYLLEIIADTDLAEGYELEWTLSIPSIRTQTGGPVDIPQGGSGIGSRDPRIFITDTVTFSDCPIVDSLWIEITRQSALYASDLQFVLTSPDGASVTLFQFSTYNSATTYSFPEVHTPHEPLTPFIGTSGNGTWELEVGYKWNNSGRIPEWSLTIDCGS